MEFFSAISHTGVLFVGIPFVYELNDQMRPIHKMQFLGDPETVKKAMEAVANQGKTK